MNIRRKNRLWIACAVLAGLALTIGLVLYALRSNIDLFYTPGEILYGKRETQQMPEVGQRLRVKPLVDCLCRVGGAGADYRSGAICAALEYRSLLYAGGNSLRQA